jgi:hypothetical protein
VTADDSEWCFFQGAVRLSNLLMSSAIARCVRLSNFSSLDETSRFRSLCERNKVVGFDEHQLFLVVWMRMNASNERTEGHAASEKIQWGVGQPIPVNLLRRKIEKVYILAPAVTKAFRGFLGKLNAGSEHE